MIEIIKNTARLAGKMILDAEKGGFGVHEKSGHSDLVTDCDVAVQSFIIKELSEKCPGAVFMGEEAGMDQWHEKGDCFVIDPIDGTTNFVRGLKHSCVSIAHAKDGVLTEGAVYNPYLDEMFYAVTGGGAYVNGKRLSVSNNPLSDSLVCMGTCPYNPDLIKKSMETAEKVFNRSLDLRRSGSAALDICYTAAGRYDMFFEYILAPWDWAAASVILAEAGGVLNQIDGSPMTPYCRSSAAAGGKNTLTEFYALLEN